MSTNTNVQLIPGDLVLSGDIKTDEVTPTFSVDRQNSRVGIGIDASSISNPYTMYVAGEMYATQLHGDGSQLTGLTDSVWGQTGDDISYADGDVSIGIADANGKRLRVHESGNDVLVADGANLRVGVATGTPQANLHVEGNAYVSSNLEVSNVNFTGNLYQNGTLFEGGGGGVWTETGSDIYYTTGNVGIGTNQPQANLHVEGNAYISGTTISSGFYGTGLSNAFVEWATRMAGTGDDRGQDITVDSSGNVYVTGRSNSPTLNVYSESNTTPATQLSNSGNEDVFIAKYFANGNVDWATRIGGTSNDYGRYLAVDSSGNIYVIGNYISSTLTLYNKDGTAFGTTLSNSGGNDVFIAKYFANGNVDWAARVGGAGSDYPGGISVDSSGNVYITGFYASSPLTLYNEDGTSFGTTLPRTSFSNDAFIAKYNTSGEVQWATRVAGSSNDYGQGISADSSGNVYVCGAYSSYTTLYNKDGTSSGTALSNSGSNDVFIAKYFTNGNLDWATKISGVGSDNASGISVDSSGNIYVTGNYRSSTLNVYSKNQAIPNSQLSNSGSNDVFIAKYFANGNVDWATKVTGTSYEYGQGIFVDSSGNVYITGYYDSDPLTFYNEDGTDFGTTLSNSGSDHVFIAKYNTNGVAQWVAKMGGTSDDYGQGISVDGNGSVYVTGYYSSSTLTLYDTHGTAFGTTLSNSGNKDVFIAKYINTPINTFTSLDSSNSLVINTNVGIGTNQPQANLHVEGNVYVSSNLEVGTANLFIDTVNSRVGISLNAPVNDFQVRGLGRASSQTSYNNGVCYIESDGTSSSFYTFQVGTGQGRVFGISNTGVAYADGGHGGAQADYAEMFEWLDGNPDADDRIGLTVALSGEKIYVANEETPESDIIGIVSASPVVLGNNPMLNWHGRWLRDDLNRYQMEEYEAWTWSEEGNTRESRVVDVNDIDESEVPENAVKITAKRRMLNPQYDPIKENEYVARTERPEWSAIGLLGRLRLIKGQRTRSTWYKIRDISNDVEEWFVR